MKRYPYMRSWPRSEVGLKAKNRIVQSALGPFKRRGLKLRYDSRSERLHWKGPKRPTMKRCKFRNSHKSIYAFFDGFGDDEAYDYDEILTISPTA